MRLTAITEYEAYVYGLPQEFSTILSSTLRIIRTGPGSGRLVGILTFPRNLRLDVAELVDFDSGGLEILEYGYVVWQGDERLYWYDSQPHPHETDLVATHPHHKHVPPDLKHHRIPAPDLSFAQPNLPFLVAEVERLFLE